MRSAVEGKVYMKAVVLAVAALALSLCAAAVGAGAQAEPVLPPAQALRRDIVAGDMSGVSHGDIERYRPVLLRVYGDSTPRPLWIANGTPTEQATALVAELADAGSRGLVAADYDAAPLSTALDRSDSSAREALSDIERLHLDAWLTLSALRFVDHVHSGRVDPRALGFALPKGAARPDPAVVVEALSRSRNVRATIDSLEPPFPRFRALKLLLARYRTLAADSSLAALPVARATVRPGDHWNGTRSLRGLLVALGDLPATTAGTPTGADSDRFDDVLVEGVRRFQRRHGLEDDGLIGRLTVAQLRTPLGNRVVQIELTMERWRWLSALDAPRLIVVNIPEFHLYTLERIAGGARIEEPMDVIVGSAYSGRRTPVFASEMRYVVFHPYWDVPPSIARREEVPHIRRDSGYAAREGMEIVRGGDTGATSYAITEANLRRVIAGTLRLRQRPGPRNALGAVKFVFPNAYNVYLHGTPEEYLFASQRRDFSHGCIRASDPTALAAFVLRDDGWDRARIEKAMGGAPVMMSVALRHPLPVYVVYATVVVDGDGVPFFYPDIYGHDATLARTLHLRAPRLVARASAAGRVPYRGRDCLTDRCDCRSYLDG